MGNKGDIMTQFALLLSVLGALALVAPAAAQTPQPHPSGGLINNPNARGTPHPLHGRACNSAIMANRAQTAVNPINGQSQAKPFISIPLNKNGGSVANATTRAQQAQACAHTR
jgi:hypothetical protein